MASTMPQFNNNSSQEILSSFAGKFRKCFQCSLYLIEQSSLLEIKFAVAGDFDITLKEILSSYFCCQEEKLFAAL